MTYRYLLLGDKVTFHDTGPHPFNVRAVSPDGRTVILSRPVDRGASAEYTMIDWERGVRGSDGTGGQGIRITSQAHHRLQHFFTGPALALSRTDEGSAPTQSVLAFGDWTPVLIATVNGHP
ncbi:hypothetical protein GCM10012320_12670 [Sinomonas cellulolyticus]|uniref:Uncharacterized protein n=1 Tax=Sinomonas cellulolyticus TaxID=2801916 RepID=A0ABS1JZQ5_9MICC|nr:MULTISPECIES: hypothetical protein [Sinomonas]MBL0704703.1 hypothetical protein [Sinomonas cellulolyticus]GHG46566.1 hypothetical protein GCM10012320_12670 [Sinomonas sp. KCTC 49339]